MVIGMTDMLAKTVAGAALIVVAAVLSSGNLAGRLSGAADDASSIEISEPARTVTPAPSAGGGRATVALAANANGHFSAHPSINGTRVTMLVDTGASVVVLSEEDASRVGVRPLPADFTARMSTANGVTLGAPVMLREVRLGDIVVRDVKAVVLQRGRLQGSLLGMTFLSRLSGFEIARDRLVLRL